MRHDFRFGLYGCENSKLVHSALTAIFLMAASESAIAADGSGKAGLAAYEGTMLTILYVSLGLFIVLSWTIQALRESTIGVSELPDNVERLLAGFE